jgi:hypothetical protein
MKVYIFIIITMVLNVTCLSVSFVNNKVLKGITSIKIVVYLDYKDGEYIKIDSLITDSKNIEVLCDLISENDSQKYLMGYHGEIEYYKKGKCVLKGVFNSAMKNGFITYKLYQITYVKKMNSDPAKLLRNLADSISIESGMYDQFRSH